MQQRLIIPARMPSLNKLLDAKSRGGQHAGKGGKRWNPYNATKSQWHKRIIELCAEQGIRPVAGAHFRFTWLEPNRTRNPDNIISAKKFIFDGLVKAKVIKNDGWSQVLSIREEYRVDKRFPGVVVDIISDELLQV